MRWLIREKNSKMRAQRSTSSASGRIQVLQHFCRPASAARLLRGRVTRRRSERRLSTEPCSRRPHGYPKPHASRLPPSAGIKTFTKVRGKLSLSLSLKLLAVGTRQAYLPHSIRTGAPGEHGKHGGYRLIDRKVRVFIAPPIDEINKSKVRNLLYICVRYDYYRVLTLLPHHKHPGPRLPASIFLPLNYYLLRSRCFSNMSLCTTRQLRPYVPYQFELSEEERLQVFPDLPQGGINGKYYLNIVRRVQQGERVVGTLTVTPGPSAH